MHSEQTFFGHPGELCLSRWNNFDDVTFDGVFHYLAIFMPVKELERLIGGTVPYERFIPTFKGAGAVIGAILSSWVTETLAGRDLPSLQNVTDDFLRLVLRAFMNAELSSPLPEAAAERRVQKVEAYLRLHLADPEMTPAHAARDCGISERQLYRDFASRGEKFGHVLRRLRLEEAAAWLLRDPEAQVTQISYDCGFVNPTHFARVFRDAFGVAPREFRNHSRREYSRATPA